MYTQDNKPSELTAITVLATDDTIIVGDTSDTTEVVKTITKDNLLADIKTYFDTLYQSIGTGISVETPTGSVNSTNTAFTATSTPKFIVTDTGTYVENFGFTLSGLNITMDLAPNTFIRSFY